MNNVDRAIAGTLMGALQAAVDAAEAGVTVAADAPRARAYLRLSRSQLAVAGRCMEHLGRVAAADRARREAYRQASPTLDLGAAAAGTSLAAVAAPSDSREAVVAINDPRGAFPGLGTFDAHDDGQTAHGSGGAVSHGDGGGEYGPQVVTVNYGNSSQVAADMPTTPVGYKSTGPASDVMTDGFSGQDQTPHWAGGRVWAPRGKGA